MSMANIQQWTRSLPMSFPPPWVPERRHACDSDTSYDDDAWSVPSASSISSPGRSVRERDCSPHHGLAPPQKNYADDTDWADGDDLSSLSSLSDDSVDSCDKDGHNEPRDIDEPWPYVFQSGDAVWVRSKTGTWYFGRVSGKYVRKGQTRENENTLYSVIYRKCVRRCFAPMLGEIKPDTPHTRHLLERAKRFA